MLDLLWPVVCDALVTIWQDMSGDGASSAGRLKAVPRSVRRCFFGLCVRRGDLRCEACSTDCFKCRFEAAATAGGTSRSVLGPASSLLLHAKNARRKAVFV